MAIEVGGKVYRNLPEQVEENANNIQWLIDTIQSFGNVMRYCGSVATYADLPTEDLRTGDVYNVLDTGNNYAWDGEAWDEISSIVDLSGYVTKIGSSLPYYELDDDDNLITFVQDHPEVFEKLIVIKIRNIDSDHPLLAFFGGVPEDNFIYTIWDANLNAIYKGGTAQSFFTLSDALNYPEYYATTSQIENMANKWVGAYVGDETAFTSEMAVGDTVVESTGGNFLINEITFSGGSLSKVVLVGLEDNGNPVVHKYESGAWSSTNYVDAQLLALLSSNNTWNGSNRFNNGLVIYQGGSIIMQMDTNGIQCNRNVQPRSNNAANLGTPGLRYRNVYTYSISNGTDTANVAEITKKPSTSYSLTDGGTITDSALKTLIQNEQPIKLNGFTCYFSCDDGTNYQYVSTRYDAVANKNHINVITINKTTWVATFHTSDIALS